MAHVELLVDARVEIIMGERILVERGVGVRVIQAVRTGFLTVRRRREIVVMMVSVRVLAIGLAGTAEISVAVALVWNFEELCDDFVVAVTVVRCVVGLCGGGKRGEDGQRFGSG